MTDSSKKTLPPIARTLAANRIAIGKTQEDISEDLGYSSSQYISNWETGRSRPPLHSLRAVAAAYEMPLINLIDLFCAEHRSFLIAISKPKTNPRSRAVVAQHKKCMG